MSDSSLHLTPAASPFTIASSVEKLAASRFAVEVPDGWQQGRGAFGGLVLALLVRAVEHEQADPTRRTRTISGDICGPVLPGRAEVHVRQLRRGSNQSNWYAELSQNGDVLACALVVTATARPTVSAPMLDAPPAPSDWRSTPVLTVVQPLGPVFAAHYEYRSTHPPFVPVSRASCDGFIRERKPPDRLDAPAMVGLLDAWWPALFSIVAEPRPTATISFTAELIADPSMVAADEPLRHRARMVALNEGFFVELRELWQGERLLALNQQTFAIIK